MDENHPAVGLLAECYIADDLGAFLQFWKENPAFGFLAVATRKGEVVDRRGLIYGGYQNARKQTHSIVQREIDLRETAKALVDEQKIARRPEGADRRAQPSPHRGGADLGAAPG